MLDIYFTRNDFYQLDGHFNRNFFIKNRIEILTFKDSLS